MTDIPLSIIGRILEGEERGRFVEVLDDADNTGGFLIFTYADEHRSPEVFDAWVENMDDVQQYFDESKWKIEWLP